MRCSFHRTLDIQEFGLSLFGLSERYLHLYPWALSILLCDASKGTRAGFERERGMAQAQTLSFRPLGAPVGVPGIQWH